MAVERLIIGVHNNESRFKCSQADYEWMVQELLNVTFINLNYTY